MIPAGGGMGRMGEHIKSLRNFTEFSKSGLHGHKT